LISNEYAGFQKIKKQSFDFLVSQTAKFIKDHA
jgi:hypothetical protein